MKYSVELESASELLSGRYYAHEIEKGPQETHSDYEVRTWRGRLHTNQAGHVFLPGEGFKRSLDESASRRGDKLKGNATFSKRFLSGVIVFEDAILLNPKTSKPIIAEDVNPKVIFAPSDGKRNGPKRVIKYFPCVPAWKSTVEFDVVDDVISQQIFKQTLEYAGAFIGVGSMRAGNGGIAGRFRITSIKKAA